MECFDFVILDLAKCNFINHDSLWFKIHESDWKMFVELFFIVTLIIIIPIIIIFGLKYFIFMIETFKEKDYVLFIFCLIITFFVIVAILAIIECIMYDLNITL